MRTEKIVYTPEVILPSKRNESCNSPLKPLYSSKRAALLTAALLAMAANAKADINIHNRNDFEEDKIVMTSQEDETIQQESKVRTQKRGKNELSEDELKFLLLYLIAGGVVIGGAMKLIFRPVGEVPADW